MAHNVLDLRILPMHKGKPTYDLPARCLNCGWRGVVQIPKGEPRPGSRGLHGPRVATCPRCACHEVVCPIDA